MNSNNEHFVNLVTETKRNFLSFHPPGENIEI